MLRVKFISNLKQYADVGNDGLLQVDFEDGLTVAGILEKTELKNSCVKYVVMVNGKRKPLGYHLCEEDDIIVMPLLMGG